MYLTAYLSLLLYLFSFSCFNRIRQKRHVNFRQITILDFLYTFVFFLFFYRTSLQFLSSIYSIEILLKKPFSSATLFHISSGGIFLFNFTIISKAAKLLFTYSNLLGYRSLTYFSISSSKSIFLSLYSLCFWILFFYGIFHQLFLYFHYWFLPYFPLISLLKKPAYLLRYSGFTFNCYYINIFTFNLFLLKVD